MTVRAAWPRHSRQVAAIGIGVGIPQLVFGDGIAVDVADRNRLDSAMVLTPQHRMFEVVITGALWPAR